MKTEDKDLERVQRLIEKAAASVGGQNELARRMGYDKGQVSNWVNGQQPCPAKAQAVMADLAGLEPMEVIAIALVAGERNPTRKEALLKALGKSLDRHGVAAFFATFAALGLAPMLEIARALVDTMRRRVKRDLHHSDAPRGAFFIDAELSSMNRRAQCTATPHPASG